MKRRHPHNWVFSGPLGGKTTLARALVAVGLPAHDTDDLRRALPGWRDELFPAWWPEHPLHREWRSFELRHRATLERLIETGDIIITHEPPPPSIAHLTRPIFIRPSAATLRQRGAAHFANAIAEGKSPEQAVSRVLAALHYWSDPMVCNWRGAVVSSNDELYEMLTGESARLT